MNDEEVLKSANRLARLFYKVSGYDVKSGYRFDKSTHPHEKLIWHQVCLAFEVLKDIDLYDTISNLD